MRTIAIKQSYLQVGANLHKTCTTVALRGAHMYNKTTKKQNNNWKRSASTPFTVDHTQSRTWRYKLAENLCITAGVRMYAKETAIQQINRFVLFYLILLHMCERPYNRYTDGSRSVNTIRL